MKIGITIGDPAGIGPEIILKSLVSLKNRNDFIIYGNKEILKKTAQDLNLIGRYNKIKESIVDCIPYYKFSYGRPNTKTAQMALGSIDCALKAKVDIIVTAPIVKDVIKKIKPKFIGHTEYLAQFFGVKNFAMVGVLKNKRIMLLTTHLPLRNVFKMVNAQNIFEKLLLMDDGLKRYFKIPNPSLAVSSLNPHGFEFTDGAEERIKKGISMAKERGLDASGPFPADSLFNRNFDGFLAIYHDQAFIYLKSQKGGTNLTMGLPIIRVSPLYGAGLDIAGTGRAETSGMINAIKLALQIYKNSKKEKNE